MMRAEKAPKKPFPQPVSSKAGVAAGLALLLVLVLGALLLQTPDAELTAARKRMFVPARVSAVLSDEAQTDTWTEGLRIGAQVIEVELLGTEYKGTRLVTTNYLNAYANVDCRVGARVIVRLDYDDAGQPYIVSVPNYDRGPVLYGMLAVFALLLILIGYVQFWLG